MDLAKRKVGADQVELALRLVDSAPALLPAMKNVFGNTLICSSETPFLLRENSVHFPRQKPRPSFRRPEPSGPQTLPQQRSPLLLPARLSARRGQGACL